MRMNTFSVRSRGVLIAALLGSLLLLTISSSLAAAAVNPPAVQPDSNRGALRAFENAFTSIAEQVEPSVVYVESERTITRPVYDPFDDSFGWPFPSPMPRERRQQQTQKSAASGVIVRSDGYIITNDHVVGGADNVSVTLSNKRVYKGTVLRDQRTDLALVKINATGLKAVRLGDSDKMKPGQWAIAIGNPFGAALSNTLTVGVVSAVTRGFQVPDPDSPNGFRTYPDAIQTDAAINKGNSGGPLVNIDGEVIGINAVIMSPSGGNIGFGFAVPSNTVKYVMDQLIAKGKVVRGMLGVGPRDLTADDAERYGVDAGALIESVEKDSPAEKAKVQVEDVVVEFAGKKVDSAATFRRVVAMTSPGTNTTMIVIRDKKRVSLKVTLGTASDEEAQTPEERKSNTGLSVKELTADLVEHLKVPADTKGVVVDEVESGSPADNAEIQAGDVIMKIGNRRITTIEEFNSAVAGLKPGDSVVVVIQRGQSSRIRTLRLE